ncbi:hypothetical protein GF345_02900 [Candidatus Woesearchaeota archaeon]|nr:hypothetical protein [Candidatus Woesearchaeota archaeon]
MFNHIPYPRQAILVTCQAEIDNMGKTIDKKNIITLSWHMPVSYDPPMYAIAVAKKRLSYEMIKRSEVFCVNFLPYKLKDKVLFCGRNSGSAKDKFRETGLTAVECEKIHCPRIKEAEAYLECQVSDMVEAGDHMIIIGEILKADEKRKGKRIFHLGGDSFTTTE